MRFILYIICIVFVCSGCSVRKASESNRTASTEFYSADSSASVTITTTEEKLFKDTSVVFEGTSISVTSPIATLINNPGQSTVVETEKASILLKFENGVIRAEADLKSQTREIKISGTSKITHQESSHNKSKVQDKQTEEEHSKSEKIKRQPLLLRLWWLWLLLAIAAYIIYKFHIPKLK